MTVPARSPRHRRDLLDLLQGWPFEGSLFRAPFAWPDLEEITTRATSTIRVEERLEKDAYVLRAELPGIDPEKDVDISVRDGVVTIRAERREEFRTEESEKSGTYRSEFRYGSFDRRLPLPAGADESSVTAKYGDGILEVRVPVGEPEALKSRKIEVERS